MKLRLGVGLLARFSRIQGGVLLYTLRTLHMKTNTIIGGTIIVIVVLGFGFWKITRPLPVTNQLVPVENIYTNTVEDENPPLPMPKQSATSNISDSNDDA